MIATPNMHTIYYVGAKSVEIWYCRAPPPIQARILNTGKKQTFAIIHYADKVLDRK